MLGEQKLADRMSVATGQEIRAVIGASRMNQPGSGLFLWAAVGATLGFIVSQYTSEPMESWAVAICVGIGLLAGMAVLEYRLRQDPATPGGVYLGVGITDDELLLCDRGFSGRKCDIVARQPIGSIVAIDLRKRFFGRLVVARFSDGTAWHFDSPRWKQIAQHLPSHLSP